MTPVERVLAELPDAKRNGKGWIALSASIASHKQDMRKG